MMKWKEIQGNKTIYTKKLSGKWRKTLFFFAEMLCILCSTVWLGGCSDKAVSFTLDTQKGSVVTQNVEEQNTTWSEDIVSTQTDTSGQKDGQTDVPDESMEASTAETSKIYVYVCGAVNQPGVVELPEGSRAEDALAAAGGFRQDAQTDYVNLAAKVEDEQMLYFPTKEEAEVLLEESRSAESALVNINTAGEEQLCTLPGIGASRARDIIAYREAHGAFANKEDIMQVSGIKESLYEKICELISVK